MDHVFNTSEPNDGKRKFVWEPFVECPEEPDDVTLRRCSSCKSKLPAYVFDEGKATCRSCLKKRRKITPQTAEGNLCTNEQCLARLEETNIKVVQLKAVIGMKDAEIAKLKEHIEALEGRRTWAKEGQVLNPQDMMQAYATTMGLLQMYSQPTVNAAPPAMEAPAAPQASANLKSIWGTKAAQQDPVPGPEE